MGKSTGIRRRQKLMTLTKVKVRDDMSGGELLVIDRQRGYIFYTMRGGVNDGYNGHEGLGYDY
jgi:hypothetical protein